MNARYEKESMRERGLEENPVANNIKTCKAQYEALAEEDDESSSSGGLLCLVLNISHYVRKGVRLLLSSSGENEGVRAKKRRNDEKMRKDGDTVSNPSMPVLRQVYQPSYERSYSSRNINEYAWDDEREEQRSQRVADTPAEECRRLSKTANVYSASQSHVLRKPPRR